MKEVGIMSMQRIYNYGSFLQAYGLKKILENIDDTLNISFVDYRPGSTLVKSKSAEPKGFQRIIKKVKEYNDIDSNIINKFKFFNHKRTYARRFFPILEITNNKNFPSNLDLLIIGSDEVFNCVQSNSNVGFSPDLFGRNIEAKRIISYAGSFGNTTLKKLNEHNKIEELTKDFNRFEGVSVRDRNSFDIVRSLGVDKPRINIDPVLAYDYMRFEDEIPKVRLFKDNYMIVYGYSGRMTKSENQKLKEYAHKNKLKILCFGGLQECCDEFIDCSPFELLAYFRDAELIVTDTFHGTIFSLINKKKFATIIRKSTDNEYGNEEKLGFLLELFGLSSQRLDNILISELENVLNNNIKYDEVFKILNEKRIETYRYLSDMLE